MDIEKLNKRHYSETDMYYRIGHGLSSRLTNYRNGIIYLEITLNNKWRKDYNNTASEMAHMWRKNHRELSQALGCKVYFKHLDDEATTPEVTEKNNYSAKKGIIFRRYQMN